MLYRSVVILSRHHEQALRPPHRHQLQEAVPPLHPQHPPHLHPPPLLPQHPPSVHPKNLARQPHQNHPLPQINLDGSLTQIRLKTTELQTAPGLDLPGTPGETAKGMKQDDPTNHQIEVTPSVFRSLSSCAFSVA